MSPYRLEMKVGEGDLGLKQGNVNIVFREAVQPAPADVVHLPFYEACLLYTSPSPRDATLSRMPSSA